MAQQYEEEEFESQEQFDDLDMTQETYSDTGSSFSLWKILLGVCVIGAISYQFFKITSLTNELKSKNLELSGTSQTVSEQKTKLSNKAQALSDMESKASKYESDITALKKKISEQEERISSLNGQMSSAGSGKEAELNAANEKTKSLEANLTDLTAQTDLLKADDLRAVALKGAKKFPKGFAKMLWSQKQGVIYLNIANLAKSPDMKEYQLSANEGDHFFKVATFAIGDGNTAWVKLPTVGLLGTKKISDFVVTLEKKGGSDKITRPFYLSGSVGP